MSNNMHRNQMFADIKIIVDVSDSYLNCTFQRCKIALPDGSPTVPENFHNCYLYDCLIGPVKFIEGCEERERNVATTADYQVATIYGDGKLSL